MIKLIKEENRTMLKFDIKKDIINILFPIFGEKIKKIIEKEYDNERPEEIIRLVYHMLTEYMGEKNANKILDKIYQKYPKLKGVV